MHQCIDVVWYTYSFKYNYSSTSETEKTKSVRNKQTNKIISYIFYCCYLLSQVHTFAWHCPNGKNIADPITMKFTKKDVKQKKPIQHSINVWVCVNAFLFEREFNCCNNNEKKSKGEREMKGCCNLISWSTEFQLFFMCFSYFHADWLFTFC